MKNFLMYVLVIFMGAIGFGLLISVLLPQDLAAAMSGLIGFVWGMWLTFVWWDE